MFFSTDQQIFIWKTAPIIRYIIVEPRYTLSTETTDLDMLRPFRLLEDLEHVFKAVDMMSIFHPAHNTVECPFV